MSQVERLHSSSESASRDGALLGSEDTRVSDLITPITSIGSQENENSAGVDGDIVLTNKSPSKVLAQFGSVLYPGGTSSPNLSALVRDTHVAKNLKTRQSGLIVKETSWHRWKAGLFKANQNK